MPKVKRAVLWILLPLALFGAIELVARIVWAYLERQATEAVVAAGEKALRNDAINFLKEPHPLYGFRKLVGRVGRPAVASCPAMGSFFRLVPADFRRSDQTENG